MRIKEILCSEECNSLFEEVQEFTSHSLSAYNKSLSKDNFNYADKDIFDIIWGTVDLSAAEVCILDSPLLQRLRYINQMGLVSFVYCNADISRFSHTIGVIEAAGRMAEIISRKLSGSQSHVGHDAGCGLDALELVRLAAIFHDTGHMFFSNVSEDYFSYDNTFPKYEEITQALTHFCSMTSSEISLHELISVMIVNSPAVTELLEHISRHLKKSRIAKRGDLELLVDYISSLIIGVPIDKYILPYATIINGAIDADKFDYLRRDSQCTKIPIAVDIPRIVRKLDVVRLERIEKTEIWDDVTSEAVPYEVMAIKNSAKGNFFQFANARTCMFDNVYYHQKILTAEMMFRKVLQQIFSLKVPEKIRISDILDLTDDAFSKGWEYRLLSEDEREDIQQIGEISRFIDQIRHRQLYKRTAAFSQNLIVAGKAAKEDFLNNIVQNPGSDDYIRFVKRLREEYFSICNILELPTCDNPDFMFIFSRYNSIQSVPVERGDGYCIWSSSLMKQDTMEAGKKARQGESYLVTNIDDRLPVYLALERILPEFDIDSLHNESSLCSKVGWNKLNKSRKTLLEKNYYRDALFILQDRFLIDQIYDKSLISDICSKYKSFTGTNKCRVDEKSLLVFLRQFLRLHLDYEEYKALIKGVIKILLNARYLDREVFDESIKTLFLSDHFSGIKKKYILNLGGLFDSANHLMYYFNDNKDRNSMVFENDLEEVLKTNTADSCVCFFDDGAYSGKQVMSIFQEYMGVPIEDRETNENHVNELSESGKDKLKKSKIILIYICFNSNSEKTIKKALGELGLKDVQIIYRYDLSEKMFIASSPLFDNEDHMLIVKEKLRYIGASILESNKMCDDGSYKERWSKDRVDSSALGYNDAQQLVVFNNNIPTYSLTAFWANGVVEGSEWTGLFQRTIKD